MGKKKLNKEEEEKRKKKEEELRKRFENVVIDENSVTKKVVVSGDIVEVWEYQYPLEVGKKVKPKKDVDEKYSNSIKRDFEYWIHLAKVDYASGRVPLSEATKRVRALRKNLEIELEKQKEINRNRSLKRTIENATRLINSNTDILKKFVTLTFRQDVVDITAANKELELFIKRVRNYLRKKELDKRNKRRKKKLLLKDIPLPKFEYVGVIEFQTLNRDYVIHYHIMMSIPYIPQQDLTELWGNGYVWVNEIDNEKNTGNYILKYMKKSFQKMSEESGEEFDFEEQLKAKKSMDKLFGRQRVLRSQGLKEPFETTKKEEIHDIESLLDKKHFEIGNEYFSDWNGEITYKRYNLKKKKH